MRDTSRQRETSFETECRRLLGITGKEFLIRLKEDDFAGFDAGSVKYLSDLVVEPEELTHS